MKLEEVESLRLQNLALKARMAKAELDAFGLALDAKYNGGRGGMQIEEDGTFALPPAPEATRRRRKR